MILSRRPLLRHGPTRSRACRCAPPTLGGPCRVTCLSALRLSEAAELEPHLMSENTQKYLGQHPLTAPRATPRPSCSRTPLTLQLRAIRLHPVSEHGNDEVPAVADALQRRQLDATCCVPGLFHLRSPPQRCCGASMRWAAVTWARCRRSPSTQTMRLPRHVPLAWRGVFCS